MVFVTFGQGIAHVQDRHQVVDIAVDALSHARILDTNAEKQMRTAGSMLLPRAFLRLPGSSWPLLCRPSAWPGGPARWTLLRRDAPQTYPACPSSWDPDRCSTLSANTHKMFVLVLISIIQDWFMVLVAGTGKLTVICLIGMKSALCRTRSKILAS